MENHLRSNRVLILLLACVLAFGIWMRVPGGSSRKESGFQVNLDENIYFGYVLSLGKTGFLNYPYLCDYYLEKQARTARAYLPPTRVLFIGGCTLWWQLFKCGPFQAVRQVSCAASCLMLLVSALFAWRLGGRLRAVGVTALVACAPLEIHMAYRAWIDSFFGLWVLLLLWSLWETLQKPGHRGWLAIYAASLACMILTKENAFFVFIALCGLLAFAGPLGFGRVTRPLVAATVLGLCFGCLGLIIAAGGLDTLIAVFRLNMEKSRVLPYAIATGDGPWARYLLDLFLLNPLVTLLAIGGLMAVGKEKRPAGYFLSLFVVITYAVMSQVKGGMNLRYGNIWTFPLSWLALSQAGSWLRAVREKWHPAFAAVVLSCLVATELWQYELLFVRGNIYDPITIELGWAQHMFCTPPEQPGTGNHKK